MKQRYKGAVRPQRKIIHVNTKLGNKNIANQQGTTIEIYDSEILTSGKLTYDIFRNAKTHDFPETNLQEGKLQPQETLTIERAYFSIVTRDEATNTWDSVEALNLAAFPGIAMGQFEFFIENQRVVKPIPLRSFFPEFNVASDSNVETVFEFDTSIVIPPLVNFRAVVEFPENFFANIIGKEIRLMLTLAGTGAIFNPRANY